MRKIILSLLFMLAVIEAGAQSYPTSLTEKHDVAILVIDMQNGFVKPGAVLCVDGALTTIPDINKLIDYGRTKNW